MTPGRLVPLALLAALAGMPAAAQAQVAQTQAAPPLARDLGAETLPPATGASAREALRQARREIAAAAESLTAEQGALAPTVAYRDVREARGAMEQALTAAKGEEGLPDEVSDRLSRAIDQTSEAVRLLEEAASTTDIDAVLEHLEEATIELDAVSGRLGS
ncbi:hypothetical protein [Arenibaculum sp.]|uniref:hypothetical protein n=1 Tax=Arenibaculum sp. TaxID=2865862 RepID=UPI002E0D4481|nr:hypothetical protein [Arenibaculum sp.]